MAPAVAPTAAAASDNVPATRRSHVRDSVWDRKPPQQQKHGKLADLVLTALFSLDSYRSAVHDDDRIACVVGSMLLAELYFTRRVGIGEDGTIRLARGASHDDDALNDVLMAMTEAGGALPASVWLDYLVQDHRAITMGWQRLVNANVAAPEEKRWWRPRPRRSLTNPLACTWARHYLRDHVTATEVSGPAVALWHGLRALRLDARALEMDPEIERRLDATQLPPALKPLFDALGRAVARLATPL